MWSMNAVSEDDKLDRDTAKKVIRRSWQLARPYRRTTQAALVLVTFWTATTLAGPVIVKFGIDEGLETKNGHALNMAVAAYVVVTVLAYFIARLQFVYINRAGESRLYPALATG